MKMDSLNQKIDNVYRKLEGEFIGRQPVSKAILNIAYINLVKSKICLADKSEAEIAKLLVTAYKMVEKNEYNRKIMEARYIFLEGQIINVQTDGMQKDIGSLEEMQADHFETQRAERNINARDIVADILKKLENNQQLKEYFQVAFLDGQGELSIQEIAKKMDISRQHCHRIAKKFKGFLAKHHEFERSDIGINSLPARAPRAKARARYDQDINLFPDCPAYYQINLEKKIITKQGVRYGRKVKFDKEEKYPSGRVLRINSKAYNSIPKKGRYGKKAEQERLKTMAGELSHWKETDYIEIEKTQWDIEYEDQKRGIS